MGLTNSMRTHLFGNFFWPAGFNFQLFQQCFFQLRPIFIPGIISEVQKTEVQGRNNVQICKLDDPHLLSPEKGKKIQETKKCFKYLYSSYFHTSCYYS